MDLTEKKISSEVVFDGVLLHVKKDKVLLPNGGTSTREYIVHNGAVAVIPVLPNGNILMEKQFRYPCQKVYLEIPAGKIDKGEDSRNACIRELKEETGGVASSIEFLCDIQPTIAYSTEIINIYVAKGLEIQDTNPDEDEFIDLIEMPIATLLKMILNNEIIDSKTCYGLLHYAVKENLI